MQCRVKAGRSLGLDSSRMSPAPPPCLARSPGTYTAATTIDTIINCE